jgi:hypothetical protein
MTRTLSEALSCRISDILEYADFRDEFALQIGKHNVRLLNEIKDLYLHDFGIFIEIAPDMEERAQLEANIQMALSKGDINLEDAIDIREIKNIKMANQLLKVKRKKNFEQMQMADMQKQQMQAQINMQSQQMSAQTAAQKIQLESQAEMQVKQAEIAFDIEKMRAEAQFKKELMAEEFMYQMKLKGVEVDGIKERDRMKEDEKAKRIDRQNTQQSKLIEQRQQKAPAISFESNEDSLDGFDFAEFEPR